MYTRMQEILTLLNSSLLRNVEYLECVLQIVKVNNILMKSVYIIYKMEKNHNVLAAPIFHS